MAFDLELGLPDFGGFGGSVPVPVIDPFPTVEPDFGLVVPTFPGGIEQPPLGPIFAPIPQPGAPTNTQPPSVPIPPAPAPPSTAPAGVPIPSAASGGARRALLPGMNRAPGSPSSSDVQISRACLRFRHPAAIALCVILSALPKRRPGRRSRPRRRPIPIPIPKRPRRPTRKPSVPTPPPRPIRFPRPTRTPRPVKVTPKPVRRQAPRPFRLPRPSQPGLPPPAPPPVEANPTIRPPRLPDLPSSDPSSAPSSQPSRSPARAPSAKPSVGSVLRGVFPIFPFGSPPVSSFATGPSVNLGAITFGQPSPVPQLDPAMSFPEIPGTQGLTRFESAAVGSQSSSDACRRCAAQRREKKKTRTKCLQKYNVAWTAGPDKGRVAGTRCYVSRNVRKEAKRFGTRIARQAGRRVGEKIGGFF